MDVPGDGGIQPRVAILRFHPKLKPSRDPIDSRSQVQRTLLVQANSFLDFRRSRVQPYQSGTGCFERGTKGRNAEKGRDPEDR